MRIVGQGRRSGRISPVAGRPVLTARGKYGAEAGRREGRRDVAADIGTAKDMEPATEIGSPVGRWRGLADGMPPGPAGRHGKGETEPLEKGETGIQGDPG